jgi:serine/threonine protein kinase
VFDHEERVQLLFGGRVLRNSLVLDNLQIGEHDVIVVHLRKHADPGFESSLSVRLCDSLRSAISVKPVSDTSTPVPVARLVVSPPIPVACWVKDISEMRKVHELGEGAFGNVTLVEDPSTHDLIALKTFRDPVTEGAFLKAAESVICLCHPCVVRAVGCSFGRRSTVGSTYFARGSLRNCSLDETEKAIIACGIVLGMKYIHSRGLVHGDLKPENIMIDERGRPQIGDVANRLLSFSRGVGRTDYRAPEKDDEADYTEAGDVYSFATILNEMLLGGAKLPMDAMVAGIITQCRSAHASDRGTFDAIWLNLVKLNFRLSPNVDSSKVLEFVSWVGTNDATVTKLTPTFEDSAALVEEKRQPATKHISDWVKDFTGMRKIRELSKGAYGTVTLVEDPSTHDLIALKTLHGPVTDITTTFFREIESLIRLAHPCIVPIVGYFLATETSRAQIGTKYAVQGSLREALRKRSLDDTGLAIVACGIVVGMKFIHSRGVMH